MNQADGSYADLSAAELRQLVKNLKKQLAAETQRRQEAEARAGRAEQSERNASMDRDKWRERAKQMEAELQSLGKKN
jgi:hypothetical protein